MIAGLQGPTHDTNTNVPRQERHDYDMGRRRVLRHPRAARVLRAIRYDNATQAEGVFDPSRLSEGDEDIESARKKVELLLSLKGMGRRFEWRGALNVFRRARTGGMVVDNSVYRSALK